MKMKTIIIFTLFGLFSTTISTYAADIEYALKIRKSNPEYGHNIPKELCANEKRNPCKISTHIMIKPVLNIKDIKNNLSNAAWSALKSNANARQEIWEFNLCRSIWNKKEPCAAVYGYAVLKKHNIVFYTFFKN